MTNTTRHVSRMKVICTEFTYFPQDVSETHTVELLSGTSFVRQLAFYGRPATKYMYILVYFTAVPPYTVYGSQFEQFSACF